MRETNEGLCDNVYMMDCRTAMFQNAKSYSFQATVLTFNVLPTQEPRAGQSHV